MLIKAVVDPEQVKPSQNITVTEADAILSDTIKAMGCQTSPPLV